MKKNVFYAQSGGVTAVINASACGVIETARKHKNKLGKVYAGRNGILGALTEDMIDTTAESARTIAALRHTPGGAFGSARYKLKGLDKNRAEYERLIEVFKAHDIGYFFYNGGGDSMDTAHKVSQIGAELGLPDRLHRRAEDRRQRSARHGHLPRLRLRREVRRRVDARGGARRRVDGAHVDARVHPRGHGPARGLDRRGGRAGRRRARRGAARHPVPRDSVRRSRVPRARQRLRRRSTSTASSSSRKARATPTAGSSPRPAARTRSATRSSAASRRPSRSSSRPSSASSTTTRSRTTCSAPRATSRRKSTSSRPMRWARPPSSSR